MYLSLNKAAKEAGISKSTLSDALSNGRLTAKKDERGRWQIDPAALFQAFPKTSPNEHVEPTPNTDQNTENRIEIERLKAELQAANRLTEMMADQVADLRERLDKESLERRNLTAMLTDQRTQESPQEARRGFLGLFGVKGAGQRA